MRFHPRTPKLAWTFLSASVVMLAAMIAGCDSGPGMNSPEVKQQLESRQASIAKEEDKGNAALKKRGGKNAEQIKSIKGGIKLPESK